MNAKKCDRCGAFYESYGNRKQANVIKVINADIYGNCPCDKTYDICPGCMEKFETWFAAQETNVKHGTEV